MKESEEETLEATVARLASLARLRIPEERTRALATEFKQILAYIGQLDELQLPVREGTPHLPPLRNVVREDAYPNATGAWTDAIVGAFPASSGNALSVKKIISHD